mmetsp:Transcript_17274/g.42321  ORF Transcript_17274/g.42321 Transcript_17274/m.42321 type:complete len:434 (+) Transcript_17274:116-1417(+)
MEAYMHEKVSGRAAPGQYKALQRKSGTKEAAATTNSAFQTAVILAKTISGTGNFALPYAFLSMGLIGGFFTIIGAALLTGWTMILMQQVKNSRYVAERNLPNETYVDIAYAGFGDYGAMFVYFVTIFCLEGCCAVYLNFVASTAHSLYPSIPQDWYLLLTLCFAVSMTMINSMRFLKYLSGLGIVAVTFTILCVMWYSAINFQFDELRTYPTFNPSTYFQSFGSIAFFFCVNVNVLPIEREMGDRSLWSYVVMWTCASIAILNILYGGFVYMLLRENTCGNVVMNLTSNSATPEWLVVLPKMTMILELVVSYPLILYAAVDIVQRTIGQRFGNSTLNRNIVTFTMASLPAVFAQINSFSILVNLVGGFGAALSAYCFPPLLFLKVCRKEFETSHGKLISCALLAIAGFAMSCMTTGYALNAIWYPNEEPAFCR